MSLQDDGHTVVLMDQPFDAHIEVLLDHANTATARRPHVGTCLAKNSLLPALGNPFHLGVRVASQIPFPLSNASESLAVTVIRVRLHAVIRRRRVVAGTLSPPRKGYTDVFSVHPS
jgi:hypothetical protein